MGPRGRSRGMGLAALLSLSAALAALVFLAQGHLFLHQTSVISLSDGDRRALGVDRQSATQLPADKVPAELPGEVWAGHPMAALAAQAPQVLDLLTKEDKQVGSRPAAAETLCSSPCS